METTQVLTYEERKARAIAWSKRLLESKRETQREMREEMQDPNSSARKSLEELRKRNAEKGHPYAV